MKRTGIFALAGACALGVSALVGGVGYASALDVAVQEGQTLDVPGVSTVEKTSDEVAESTTLDNGKGDPTPEPTDPATEAPVAEAPVVDEGTADQGSDDAVDEVDPSDPVVIPDDGIKDPDAVKGCGKGDHDGDFGDRDDDGVTDPVEGDASWTGDKDWSDDDSTGDRDWTGDAGDTTQPDGEWTGDTDRGDRSGDGRRDGNRGGGDRGDRGGDDRGGSDRSDRGGDRGQGGGGHGHGGGGHHGGRG